VQAPPQSKPYPSSRVSPTAADLHTTLGVLDLSPSRTMWQPSFPLRVCMVLAPGAGAFRMVLAMTKPKIPISARPLDFWLARGAVLVIAVLQFGIVNDLTIGPRWLAPSLELALLLPLSIATAWTQSRARKASSNAQLETIGRDRRWIRLSLSSSRR
jgi:hypothetical protein